MAFFDTKWPAALLWPLSRLYGSAIGRRNRRYDTGQAAASRLPSPVISVGNLVVGGTGKTPTVVFLARWLQERGKKVCVISRGYRRKSKGLVLVADGERICSTAELSGDEPILLAQELPGAVVVVDADRVEAGRYAIQRFKPDLILLDDGFQHRRLHRDLDIVTFKGVQDLGNGWLLPAGPLREPAASLDRADLFWFNGPAGLAEEVAFAAWPAQATDSCFDAGAWHRQCAWRAPGSLPRSARDSLLRLGQAAANHQHRTESGCRCRPVFRI